MVRLRRSIDVDATDLGPLIARIIESVPGVLAALRRLQFADGAAVHPDTGERHEGLSDTSGTHPRPGTHYSIVMADESLRSDGPWTAEMATIDEHPVERRLALRSQLFERHRDRAAADGLLDVTLHEAEVELLHDDVARFAVRVVNVGAAPFAADVRLTRPARPDELTVDVVVPVTARFVAGDIEVKATVNVGSIPGGIVSRPQIRVDARHRRGRLGVIAKVTDRPGGRWSVDVSVSARGSGWIRPFAAVALHIGRRKIREHLDDNLADSIDDFESGLSEVLAAEPVPTAENVVAEMVGGCVQDLHQARRLAAESAVVVSTFTLRASPPPRCPKWAWRSSAPDLDVGGRSVAVDWAADQTVEIVSGGSWIATKDWNGYGALRRTSVRVLVRPGDVVDYQERWWSFATPRLSVVGRR